MNTEILDAQENKKPLNPFAFPLIALSIILVGGFIGASTNVVNGWISEAYFMEIMRWEPPSIWERAVFQGILEGTVYGIIFSIIYTITFAVISRGRGTWRFAIYQILKTIPIIYICWAIGGVLTIILSFIFYEPFNEIIFKLPNTALPRIKYAWVGGSIWGGMIGGVVGVVYSIVITSKNWHRLDS